MGRGDHAKRGGWGEATNTIVAVALTTLTLTSPALAVFGGKPLTDSDPLAKSVVAVRYETATGVHLCTGVVLAPKLVLTAAHCTEGDRSLMRVLFTTTLTDIPDARIRSVANVAKAKPTPDGKGAAAFRNPDDIALLLLDKPVPTGVVAASLAENAGTSIRIAGYGAQSELRQSNGRTKQTGYDGLLKTATMQVKATGTLLTADQSRGSGVCTGDSGGPAFTTSGAVAGILIGVSSKRTATDYCRGSAYFASLARWKSWIVSTAAGFKQPLTP